MEDNSSFCNTNVEGPCCSECCAFRKVYSKFCNIMTDIDNLSKYFVEKGIINDSEVQHILETSKTAAQKVQKILIHISNPLESGSTTHFYLMLEVMEQYGSAATKKLAQDLREELTFTGSIKGKHNLPYDQRSNNKRMKLDYTSTAYEDYHLDEIPDETFLMNYVPMISHKWITIAIRLGFTTEQITEILNSKELLTLSSRDSEYSCCSKLLRKWIAMRTTDCSYHKLFLTLSSPQVELSKVANTMHSDLKDKIEFSKVENLSRIGPPDRIQTKYMFMIKDVVEELNKSNASVEQLKQLLEYDYRAVTQERIDPAVYKHATNWSEFIKAFQRHKYITNSDLSWLNFIVNDYAECTSAAEKIENYFQSVKNTLILNQLPWKKPNHSNEAFLRVKTDKEPSDATIECLLKATDVAVALTGGQINKTDAKLFSASVGSVSYFWKIPLQTGLNLRLPQTITAELKQLCEDASVIYIGVMAGNRTEKVDIAQLQVISTEDDISRRLDEPCKYHHVFKLSKEIKKWEPLASHLGFSEEEIKTIKCKHSKYSVQKIKVLCKWITRHKFAATPRVLQGHVSGCIELVNSATGLSQSLTTTAMEQYTVYLKQIYKSLNLVQSGTYTPLTLFELESDCSSQVHMKGEFKQQAKQLIELKDVFHFQHRKCIWISGAPGTGKSTLAKKICVDWANGCLLKEYNAVILMQLQSWIIHNVYSPETIENIASWLLIKEKQFQQEILKEIYKSSGSNICFILDGYDEIPMELCSESLFSSILNTFANSTVVCFSRPLITKQLKNHCDTLRNIEIGGFSEDGMKQYIRNAFNACKTDRSVKKLLHLVKVDPMIQNFAYNPLYLSIICHLLINQYDLLFPTSFTQLYESYIESKMALCQGSFQTKVERDLQVLKISAMAFNGIKSHCFLFSKPYLQTITNELVLFELLALSNDTYTFLHLSVQEFLAALYISQLSEAEQFESFTEFKDYPNFENVWVFYAGLTKLKTPGIAESLFPTPNIVSFLSKYDWIRSIKSINEIHHLSLNEKITEQMSGCIDLSGCNMDISWCITLAYFIANCSAGSIKTLILDNCKISDDGLLQICKSLKTYFSNCTSWTSKVKMTNYQIMDLCLSDNNLTVTSANHIKELLAASPLISRFTFNGNYRVGDQGIAIILGSLLDVHTLKELDIENCALKTKGMQALSRLLARNNKNLNCVNLSDNDIDLNMLNSLSEALAKNTTVKVLSMRHCGVGINVSQLLDGVSKERRNALEILSICDHRLQDNPPQALLVNHFKTFDALVRFSDIVLCKDSENNLNIATTIYCHECLGSNLNRLLSSMSIFIKALSIQLPTNCQSFSNALSENCTLEDLEIFVQKSDDFETLIEGIKKNTGISKLKIVFKSLNVNWLLLTQNLLSSKTNLTMLSINGKYITDDNLLQLVAVTLLKSKNLVSLKCTPQKGITPSNALKFLLSLKVLDSLRLIVLTLQDSKITKSMMMTATTIQPYVNDSISCEPKISKMIKMEMTTTRPYMSDYNQNIEPVTLQRQGLQNYDIKKCKCEIQSGSSKERTIKCPGYPGFCGMVQESNIRLDPEDNIEIIRKMEKLITRVNDQKNRTGKEKLQLFLEFA